MKTTTAIVILCTGEYWKGAKVLFHTLAKHGRLPDSVDRIALGMPRCDFATGVAIEDDYSDVPVSQKHFPKVADKFAALKLLGYDRIILMDADMLCVGDCSYLWSDHIGQLPFYACRDTASVVYYGPVLERLGLDPHRLFNAGTMIFQMDRLSPCFYDDVMQAIRGKQIEAYDGGDQGYLNAYFQRVAVAYELGYLPQEYNGCTDQYIPQLADHAKRIIHFTGGNVNPWAPQINGGDWRWKWIRQWQAEWKECNG